MKKISEASREELELIENAWLGINVKDKYIINPIKDIPEAFKEEPHIFLTYMLSRPDYFGGFCKYVLNIDLFPFQLCILRELWYKKFAMLVATRGGAKSFTIALFSLLRAVFLPGRKVVICSNSFRAAKNLFEYLEKMVYKAPMLKSMFSTCGARRDTDSWKFTMDDSSILAVPASEKTRGIRSNDLFSDEFATMNVELFETVFAGFGVVNSDPVQKVVDTYKRQMAEQLGIILEDEEDQLSNSMMLVGSAYYSWNHMAKYHQRWHDFICSGDDKDKLSKIYGDGVPEGFRSRDYGIIRLPHTLYPKNFMDPAQISRSKASILSSIFNNEFEAVFSDDSDGFFRRSLIENATCSPGRVYINDEEVSFEPILKGDPFKEYIMGIDPASENDNLAISILELQKDKTRRVVYSWVTNKKDHREKIKTGSSENDYFGFVSRKIRELMSRFNIVRIMMDAQGGGYALMEALRNKGNMKDNEMMILPVRPTEARKYEQQDYEEGLHIVEMVQFASAGWTSQANHGLKKDIEERAIIFPHIDGATLAIAIAEGSFEDTGIYDTIPTIMEDIELLKDELSTITVHITPGGRESFSTPDEIVNGKKGRQKKDRYSALLMANMGARIWQNASTFEIGISIGGFAKVMSPKSSNLYHGNEDFAKAAAKAYSSYN